MRPVQSADRYETISKTALVPMGHSWMRFTKIMDAQNKTQSQAAGCPWGMRRSITRPSSRTR